MQMCPKKYEKILKQMHQYEVFAVITDKNIVKDRVKQPRGSRNWRHQFAKNIWTCLGKYD